MTIAIGMLCGGGAILCADSKVVLTDGSAIKGAKIHAATTSWGSYGIADSANDANAAKTLVRRVAALLDKSAIKNWDDLEVSISYEMTEWSRAYREVPTTSLIVASFINGHGVDLCLCEPPNTVLPKPEGYVATGGGAAVTDPLYKTLFESGASIYYDPQRIMRLVAYLMYRAKADHALCGGRTHAIYIRSDGKDPELVNSLDFEAAENQSRKLDFILQAAAKFSLLSEEGSNLENNAAGLGQMMINLAGLRATKFHNTLGDLVGAS